MVNEIFETSIGFIEHSIELLLQTAKNKTKLPKYTDLKRGYFAGATLCLDTEDEFGCKEVFTINHSDETFGLLDGGLRRILSIKALKSLEELMVVCKINHERKWLNN